MRNENDLINNTTDVVKTRVETIKKHENVKDQKHKDEPINFKIKKSLFRRFLDIFK